MNIYDYTKDNLADYCIKNGGKSFSATQIYKWLYKEKALQFSEMSNISKDLRNQLQNDFKLDRLGLITRQDSDDGTIKFLFKLDDGNLIETVVMSHHYGKSVCVTTQVGCNIGCKFCASGQTKKVRDLSAGEVVRQVLSAEELIETRISHVVIMGIGEPFDNYDNTMDFIRIINDAQGLNIGARHITVSTSGLIPRIKDFASTGLQVNLAISLHASSDHVRGSIMPINNKYSLNELIAAISEYIDVTNRRVTIEYILIDGVNDTVTNAEELYRLLKGLNVYINLIPYNEVDGTNLRRSREENMTKFYQRLKSHKLNVVLRREQGHDIDAACGQLRVKTRNN